MSKVISKDGTEIAYETKGAGRPVILVDGALCYRGFGPMPRLSELLSPDFKVYLYDRRARGESNGSARDATDHIVDREIEDIDALVQAAGGSASLFGSSSGGCLAMQAAARLGSKITKLAMWEPPYNSDPASRAEWKEYRRNLADALAAGRRGDAVVLFMRLVSTPAEMVEGMRQSPMWPTFEAVAPTLAYDAADMGDDRSIPVQRAAQVTSPTLVMNGTVTPFMAVTAATLAGAIAHAQQRTLEGQSHDVNLEVLAPVLVDFFRQ